MHTLRDEMATIQSVNIDKNEIPFTPFTTQRSGRDPTVNVTVKTTEDLGSRLIRSILVRTTEDLGTRHSRSIPEAMDVFGDGVMNNVAD